MTLQPRPNNPIEARKQAVRKYSRNAVAWSGGGVVGGVALGFIFGSPFSFTILVLGLVIGVIGGFVNYNRVQRIINHKDKY